ncbi:uncharacterized protein FTJAE_8298 [Fusarium tjaetaba]|uniref:Uncharacterized protein n=1 Tax=Fusarium tjaetaba TaxID=1567544 RepID=A0A8H5RBF3_9HYPO|nr:uncharacterized protein FTJAE_8298 [Fusarium tjaetaba]KAF5630147.1 hypothetical protein FTJAE_8298 [Fusarium tjaetaba]
MDIDSILKRKRSFSNDDTNDSPPLKISKPETLSEHVQELKGSVKGSVTSLIGEVGQQLLHSIGQDRSSPGFDIGGAWVTNIRPVALDASGEEVALHFSPNKASSLTPDGLSQYGLPTPDPSPLPKEADPFLLKSTTLNSTVTGAPVSLESLSNSAYVGDLKLFGLIPSKIYVYEHAGSLLHPYNEEVKIAAGEAISLGTFIPSLKGSEWDMISLENPILGFQEEVTLDGLRRRTRGLYFETDVAFRGAMQPVSDFLQDFFHQEKPAIRFSTWLGGSRDYAIPLSPPSFVLRGSLEHVSVNVLDILTFREIGVELSGYQTYRLSMGGISTWQFEYGFFGEVDLRVPGSVIPLQVEYYLRKSLHSWLLQLRLKDNEWRDIFGIKDLNLSEVSLEAEIQTFSKETAFSVRIAANLDLRNTKVGVRGYYSKDYYSLEAYIGDLTLHDVGEIFHELIGIEMDKFSHDVTLQSMLLCISSKGFALRGEVTINGHTSTNGCLEFSRDGIVLQGSIGDIEFEHVLIKSACLDVFISSKLDTQCARASKVDIYGQVNMHSVELKATLHTEKTPEGDFRWTIYGEVEGDVTTSKIVPDLKGTFLDISLKHLALIASNHEAPLGSYKGINYPVDKGIQFCASIDRFPQLEELMRGSVKGTVFRAALVDGQFALSIIFPADRTMTFGKHVYTGPLMIEIVKSDLEFQMILKALLNLNLETQPDPLQFSLGLKASYSGAAAYAQMLTDWTNPCDVGRQITVKGCALDFGIVYATFFTTGLPGTIGLAGQIMIGQKEAKLAMKLSQNPKEQILVAAVKDLGVVDLVEFASQICEYQLPKPDNLLHFNDIQLYLSTGASIGETYYPPGASLKGDITIFGKRAKCDCTIGKMVKIMATIEHFDLGPLKVKGATGEYPIVDIELSSSIQRVLIDGAVDVWALSAAVHLEAEVYPKPRFDFGLEVSLSDWFKFKLEAKLAGEVNFKDLSSLANADFTIYGLMEQHILDKIIDMLDKQIKSIRDHTDFNKAKRVLSDKENEFNSAVEAARSNLYAARQNWELKERDIISALDSAKYDAQSYKGQLEDKVASAEKSYASAIVAAMARLDQARHDSATTTHLAEIALQKAHFQSQEVIRQAQSGLIEKRDAFKLKFGSARSDLEQTRRSLEEAVAVADKIEEGLEDIDHRLLNASLLDMPPLLAEKAASVAKQLAATSALEAIRAAFHAAELILQRSDFIAAETAIATDEASLESLVKIEDAAMTIARTNFEELKSQQDKMVQCAAQALEDVEKRSCERGAATQAKAALADSQEIMELMVSGAGKAFDDRFNCAEHLAVISAEKALQAALNNTVDIELARQACELAEQDSSSFADDIMSVGLNIGRWIASAAADLINITKIEFSGSISSLVANGPPLIVNVQGKLLDQDINLHINWQPNFNLAEFIKAIFRDLWEIIKNVASDFLNEIKAKVFEVAEDIAEGVVEVAADIKEGVEHAVDVIDDVVSDVESAVGHAADDVVLVVDDAMSDIGSVFNDAGSAVGHVADDVVFAVDHAMNDVGGFFNDAGDVVTDVGNDIGDAFNDVGHAISDFFSF